MSEVQWNLELRGLFFVCSAIYKTEINRKTKLPTQLLFNNTTNAHTRMLLVVHIIFVFVKCNYIT